MAKPSDPKAKIENPTEHYRSPEELINDRTLSAEEMKQSLNTWEQDARQKLTASDEGMPGPKEGLEAHDSHRLGEVVRAKDKIGQKPKHKPAH